MSDQLGIAKSGVSRRLADLESRLGARLINRTTRRSSLSDAGRRYYDGAVKMKEELQAKGLLKADPWKDGFQELI